MKNTTTITIHEGVATLESGEQSKSIGFFASLSDGERLDILEAARIALGEEHILELMDMNDECAATLREKVSNFMK